MLRIGFAARDWLDWASHSRRDFISGRAVREEIATMTAFTSSFTGTALQSKATRGQRQVSVEFPSSGKR